MQVATEQATITPAEDVSVPSEPVAMKSGTSDGRAKRKADDDATPAEGNSKKPRIGKELVYQPVGSLLMDILTEAKPPPLKR